MWFWIASALAAMTGSRQVDPDPVETSALDERYGKWREVYDTFLGWTV